MARSEPTTPNRLAVDRLTAGYGGSVAVRQVTLRVGPGEAVALLGRNGAGKSTTLMAIAGALRPMTGSVQIDGQAVAGLPSYRVARSGVSLVPQGRRIFATLSVRENLALASGSGKLAEIYSLFPALGCWTSLRKDWRRKSYGSWATSSPGCGTRWGLQS